MALLTKPATLVWLFLMAATCVTTWGLSKDQFTASVATLSIILIAAIKVRLVLLHFMELRHAPLPWRLLLEAWVLVVTGAIAGFYLHTAPLA
ncbi:cytochrome C oxidase subunit IV family protein [Nevskia ramosa]|uniref:cytochrome C oxidase subunit IV family protein n=1 Tax=Nevskia ramosa TaxID=64002 RepID=UPI0003B676EC|nr:cytochrome C oxidase subunit IV family protein [Nevskia ramosa]